MKKIILGFVLVNLLAACASEPAKEEVSEPTPAPTEAAAPVAAPVEPAPTETAPVAAAEPAIPEIRSAYFPFDVDAVQESDRSAIQAHGEYLGNNPSAKVRVEGNADERGSSEYNLALGQRRANNVKKLLVLSGAKTSQIETMSFGEEKPRATGHDEASWSQNRRADIVYK
ncbi:MAG: peptidoglycan-associated lipoprotein Pal [Nitrosomonadales bacterium]|nr:peptidoglycan-associated lipoprotein Pal [Nitrosomonadales bacterium]